MLEIALERVCYIIAKAREFDVKVGAHDDPDTRSDDDDAQFLEDWADDPTQLELREAIAQLAEDEQVQLVALAWIGRGDFTADEWDEAVAQAAEERTTPTADYLIGTPLLSDYLEEGLNELGLSCDDVD